MKKILKMKNISMLTLITCIKNRDT